MKFDEARIVFRPEYVDLLDGDHLAALMLGQIVYWYLPGKNGGTKLRVQRDGQWWLVKSHVDWERELRLSRRQSQRCLEVLRTKGHILTERYMFNGHPTIHLRLSLVVGNLIPIAHLESFHCALAGNPLHQNVQCITEITTETTTDTLYATGVAGGQDMNLAETMKSLEEKKNAKPTGKVTASGLAMLWKKRVSVLADGNFVKNLTAKEVGQLKHLIPALGDRSYDVVDWAIQNWSAFAWEVKAKKGLATAPEQAVVGFLVAHHDVAMQLIAKPAAPKPAVAPAPKFDKPTEVKKNTPEDKVGAAELHATMALLDQLSGT